MNSLRRDAWSLFLKDNEGGLGGLPSWDELPEATREDLLNRARHKRSLLHGASPEAEAICKAFGLPANTQSFTLKMAAGELAEVSVTYTPVVGTLNLDRLETITETFVLQRKEPA